jgi:Phosphotransferase enzyme family
MTTTASTQPTKPQSKARLPVLAARVVASVARERLVPATVRSPMDIPPTADALTSQWLTAVLCHKVPGAAVQRFEVTGGSDGTSSRRALRITYNEAGQAAGLPTALFMKSASSLQSRLFLVLGGVTECETIFYRDLRPRLPELRSPRAFHAATDPATFRSIALMDDLSADGWTFPDPMADTVGRRDAEDMVDQMAYYHAAFWDDVRLDQVWRLPTTVAFQRRLNALGIEKRALVGIERGRDAMPSAIYRRKAELMHAVMRSLELNSAGTPTLLHQDVHHGNWLRDPDGRMGLYDWQAVARGEWALDYSYAMAVNLTIENRRAWERDLLERYLAQLAGRGVRDVPSFDQAWLRYRQQPFHVVIFAALTIGANRLMPDMQPRDYMLRCWERITTFLDDHDSLDSLK